MYLKDFVDIVMGQSPDSKFYNYDKIGLPFYQGKADFGRLNPTPKMWCSKSKKEAKPNDILISVRAPVGDLNINIEQSCIGRGLAAIRCKVDVDMMYIYYHLKYLKPQLKHISTGSTFESINRSQLEDLIINYKPYIEQIKISNILQVVQRQIEVKENLLKVYDLLIKSRFVEMFGNPIINDKKYPVFKLKDISKKIGSGFTPRGGESNYIKEGIAFIRSMNIHNNTFKKENLTYIDEFVADQLSSVEIYSRDLLLNITGGSVARCCTVPNDILPARVNQHVCIIRQCKVPSIFLEYCLTNESYQEYLLLLSKKNGATREALTKTQVENLEVIVPPLIEINRFVKIEHQINKLKSDVQKSIDETQLLMDSLMQEYFG